MSGQEFWIRCWEDKGRCDEEGVGAAVVMRAHDRERAQIIAVKIYERHGLSY